MKESMSFNKFTEGLLQALSDSTGLSIEDLKKPYLLDRISMNPLTEEITVMKTSDCGPTECLMDGLWYDLKDKDIKKLNNYMNDLKTKYPDWRGECIQ